MFLELISFLCGTALAVAGSLTFWPVQHWWDFYIPIVLYMAGWLASIALLFLIEWIAGWFVNHKKEYTKVSKWARFWLMQGTVFIANHAHIWVKKTGLNKIPQREKFLIVCNHRSKFDNFIITNVIGKLDIAFITKRSNYKIPFANGLMPGLCYIPIDRDDKLQSLEAFKRATTLIETGATSIGVFPEGTRRQDGILGDFHEGVFNIAIHAKAPIVVMTLNKTEKIHKNWPWKATAVNFDVLTTITSEEYEGMTAKAVSDMVHEMMDQNLKKYQK